MPDEGGGGPPDGAGGPTPGRRSVLLVGNPALPLKGFDVAVAVLAIVNRVLPIDVTWVCQARPTPESVPNLATCGLRIALHVSPPQARPQLLPENCIA